VFKVISDGDKNKVKELLLKALKTSEQFPSVLPDSHLVEMLGLETLKEEIEMSEQPDAHVPDFPRTCKMMFLGRQQ